MSIPRDSSRPTPRRRRRRRTRVPRRDEVAAGSDPLWPAGVDPVPSCPTCGGRRTVVALDADGRPLLVACAQCAPNDALGG